MPDPLGPLMVDVAGLTLLDEEREFLRSDTVGAVILFGRNFVSKHQVEQLVSEIKSLRNPSLLIAVDQEGGRVQRFRDGFFSLPAAAQLGRLYDQNPQEAKQLSRIAGTLMATELIEIGVDFSFAPVLDRRNDESLVIADRGFHKAPQAIVEMAGNFIDGMNSAGMAATGKHFPGHGGVIGDSHLIKPVDGRSLEQMESTDLVPFRRLMDKLDGIMTAHVEFPRVDTELPTFSSFWLKDMLRDRLGFQGVVFSDDLSMKGAHGARSARQRTEKALAAGCDMCLICNHPESARVVARQLSYTSTPNQTKLDKMRANAGEMVTSEEKMAMQERLSTLS